MSVYHKENPEFLRESLMSMLNQTKVPNEIVLVKDGPLTDELEEVLKDFKDISTLKIISLEKNVGLGKALNIGLSHCSNELIARMDTDDISYLDRCEKQIEIFNQSRNSLSVIGSAIEEFIDSPDNIVAYKTAIESHESIKKQMKYRNPIAHPSVMFKKSHVNSVGSYKDWFLNEDYYLWIRMMEKGFIFSNIDEPLVKMRINNETYLRRGGWKYFITQKKLFDYMLQKKIINIYDYLFNNIIRFVTRVVISNNLRKIIYLKFLRSEIK
ncbi:glycosyltransferase [Planomicrobium okeanokoites]|uniref:glycosyltransferase n=1 Tax=Planomicrobium okeanokoites TaxID=244 RepID=UPI0024915EBE|nr:glycosyltransferase [Planomicrobium okeanokoites]